MKRLSLLLVSSISPLFAGGFGYWIAGYGYGKVPGIGGYPTPNSSGTIWGGEGYGLIKRFVVGGGGYGLNIWDSKGGGYITSSNIYAGYFSIGYAVLKTENLLVFPSLRVGGGGYTIRIREVKTGSYGQMVDNPPKYIVLDISGLYVGASVGLIYRISSIFIGISAGSGYVPLSSYYINENEVQGVQGYRKPVIWLSLLLGGGYWK